MCFLWHGRQKQPLSRDCILAWPETALSFPFVISEEGTASLKSRVGQGGSLSGGFEQKLKGGAKSLLPTRQVFLGFSSPITARDTPGETNWQRRKHHRLCTVGQASRNPFFPLSLALPAVRNHHKNALCPALRSHRFLVLGLS